MRFDVVTLMPALFDALTGEGVVARAIERGIVKPTKAAPPKPQTPPPLPKKGVKDANGVVDLNRYRRRRA